MWSLREGPLSNPDKRITCEVSRPIIPSLSGSSARAPAGVRTVTRTAAARSLRKLVIDHLASHHRAQYLDVLDLVLGAFGIILGEHGQIGELAGFDGALLL